MKWLKCPLSVVRSPWKTDLRQTSLVVVQLMYLFRHFFCLLTPCMKLRQIYGIKHSELQLPFALRYLTTNGKRALLRSRPVRPEVSKGEREFLRKYEVSYSIKVAASAASG